MRDSLFCEAGLVVAAVGGWRQRGIAGCTLITGYYLPLVQLSTSVKFSPGVAAVAAASVSFVAFAAPASGEVSRFTDSEVVRLTRVASSCQAASSTSSSSRVQRGGAPVSGLPCSAGAARWPEVAWWRVLGL